MFRRILDGVLPPWMRPDHPATRLLVGRTPRASGAAIVLGMVGIVTYLTAVIQIVFFFSEPFTIGLGLVMVQILVSATLYGHTSHILHRLRYSGTWDMVRSTAGGARQAVRAAWVSAFYRIGRGSLLMLYLPRLLLVAVFLYDLSAFRGEYLDQIVGSATPSIPWVLGVPLVGLLVSMSLALPLTSLSVEAATGVLLSTFTRSSWVAGLTQTVLILLRVGWAFMGLILSQTVISRIAQGGTSIDGQSGWISLMLSGTLSDHAAVLLDAQLLDGAFTSIPYIAFLGVALLMVGVVHLLLTEGLLAWARAAPSASEAQSSLKTGL